MMSFAHTPLAPGTGGDAAAGRPGAGGGPLPVRPVRIRPRDGGRSADGEGATGESLPAFLRALRHRTGMSQEKLAWRLDVSTRTVSNWERGHHRVDPGRLDDIADALQLAPDEHRELARLAAAGGPAAERTSRLPPRPGLLADYAGEWHRSFRDLRMPAFVRDASWDVLVCNPAFDAVFSAVGARPGVMPRENFARFVALHPEARRTLEDWHDSWLLPILCDIADGLRSAAAGSPLHGLVGALTARRCVARAWADEVPVRLARRAEGAVLPAAARRPLRHPDPAVGRVVAHISAMEPEGLPGYRSVFWRLDRGDQRRPAAEAVTIRAEAG